MKITDCITNFIGNCINNKPGYKLIQMKRYRCTMGFVYAKFKTLELKSLYIQMSTKDPWWIPHYDPHYGKNNIPLFGWLFFYIGIDTECLLCPIDKYDLQILNAKPIEDENCNMYYAATRDEEIIRQHRNCLKHGVIPKARFNRFVNTITYYN